MKNKTLFFLVIITFLSCEKENDIFQYSLHFDSPTPADKEINVAFRSGQVHFSGWGIGGLAEYAKEYKLYLDTINPPVNCISGANQINYLMNNYKLLQPNTNYYWAYSLEIPSGEIFSEIQQFRTMGFHGIWKLDSIADKKGSKEMAIYYKWDIDWINFWDWNGESRKFTLDKRIDRFTLNQDSALHSSPAITQIEFTSNSAKLKCLKNNNAETSYAEYNYDVKRGSIIFKNKYTTDDYTFEAIYLGYSNYYEKVVLLLLTSNYMLYIYSQQ